MKLIIKNKVSTNTLLLNITSYQKKGLRVFTVAFISVLASFPLNSLIQTNPITQLFIDDNIILFTYHS